MMKRMFGCRSGTAMAAAERRNCRRSIQVSYQPRMGPTTYNGWVDPRQEYSARLAARRSVSDRYQRTHIAMGNWRVLIALSAVVLAVLSWGYGLLSGWFLLVPLAASIILAVLHDGVLRRKRDSDRAAGVYEAGLARLDDRWAGK